MLVIPERKALVVRVRDPQRILTLVPKAKTLTVDGKDFVAIPHRIDETRVLNNIGISAPSPIRYHYNWSGTYTPFKAQLDTAEFLTLRPRAYVLSEMGCVDADTEYLSPTGWKRIADYAGGKVAQYVPETGKAEFVDPTEFVKKPCENMIRLKTSRGVDQLLSPEHRVLYVDHKGERKVAHASDVLAAHRKNALGWKGRIITTFDTDGGAGIQLTDDALRVQVAVMADGHFPPNNTTRCVVRLKKQRKVIRMRELLSVAGIKWKERDEEKTGFTVFSFEAPMREKSYGSWAWAATQHQLEIIAEECGHWDGSQRKAGATGFYTNDKPSADFIQYAFSATGRTAALQTNVRQNGDVEYVVHARDKAALLYVCGQTDEGVKTETIYEAPSTDGFKYCFMVPSTFLVLRRNGCVFMTGNTGKSMSSLWAYDYLREIGAVHRMLVVCPLSTMERTWADEVFKHFPHLNAAVVHGSRKRRLSLLDNRDFDIYVINHDGLEIIADELAKRPDIDIVVLDEISQAARNASTDRWKVINQIVNKQQGGTRWCWGMTGTPTPNAPTDAWAQCRIVTPNSVPPYFNRFKNEVMRQVNNFLWVARPDATDKVHAAMQPAIRFSRAECVDLPETTYTTRTVNLSQTQNRAYKQMFSTLCYQAQQGQVLAVNEAVKASKLVQIACGIIYDNNGVELQTDAGPRLDVVEEIVTNAEGKTIVFVPFVSAVKYVADFLRSKNISVECIYGEVSKHERDRIFSEFQNATDPRVIVAQPAAMSHGLTLVAANTIVWYAPIFSNDVYEQACARITRPGQTRNTLIVNIEGSPIERKAYDRLRNKQKMQGILLSMVEETRVETLA
jgi:SNF2-related domain/Helicase conserved C-terminal domain